MQRIYLMLYECTNLAIFCEFLAWLKKGWILKISCTVSRTAWGPNIFSSYCRNYKLCLNKFFYFLFIKENHHQLIYKTNVYSPCFLYECSIKHNVIAWYTFSQSCQLLLRPRAWILFHVIKKHICFENTPRRSPMIHIWCQIYYYFKPKKRGK